MAMDGRGDVGLEAKKNGGIVSGTSRQRLDRFQDNREEPDEELRSGARNDLSQSLACRREEERSSSAHPCVLNRSKALDVLRQGNIVGTADISCRNRKQVPPVSKKGGLRKKPIQNEN